jgi:hypothetical protein
MLKLFKHLNSDQVVAVGRVIQSQNSKTTRMSGTNKLTDKKKEKEALKEETPKCFTQQMEQQVYAN